MLTPEEIKAMSDEDFYPHLRELAMKTNSGSATGEELEEFRLMWDNVDDRATEQLRRDAEFNREEREGEREEFKRFLDARRALLKQPQPNRFEESQKVRLRVNVSPESPAGAEGLVIEVSPPKFSRYREGGQLMFSYELVTH